MVLPLARRLQFDTPLGRCELGYSERGLTRIALLEEAGQGQAPESGAPLEPVWPVAVPEFVSEAIERLQGYLAGDGDALSAVALDMSGLSPFARRVYEAARQIPAGTTVTYGDLAHRVGSPGAARAVGGALGRNPFLLVVPCHRVVGASGKLVGFSAPGGTATKSRLLAHESHRSR